MKTISLLLFLIPMLVWADQDTQDAFDSGLFGEVIQDLRKPYKIGQLSINEVFLLAQSYRELGQLRYARDVLTNSILSEEDQFTCKESLTTEQCVEGFILLSSVYEELDSIGKKNCNIKINQESKEKNAWFVEKYFTKAKALSSFNLNISILKVPEILQINVGLEQMKNYLSQNDKLELAKQTYYQISNLPNTYQKYNYLLELSSRLAPNILKQELKASSNHPALRTFQQNNIYQCSIFLEQHYLLACNALIQALDTVAALKKENKQLVYPVWAELAKLYANEGYYREAISFLQQTIYTVQAEQIDNKSESLFYWQWLLGKLLFREGKTINAVEAYESASYQLDILKQRYLSMPNHLNENIESFYFDYMDTLFKAINENTNLHLKKSFLGNRFIGVIEDLKVQQLKQYFHIDCTSSLEEKNASMPKSFKNFDDFFSKSKRADSTAILYYALSRDASQLAIILKQKKQIIKKTEVATYVQLVKLKKDFKLKYEIQRFRELIKEKADEEDVENQAYNLYKILFDPVKDKLNLDTQTLVIVPMLTLHKLPFSALYDGEEYLIGKYNTVISPAGSQLIALQNTSNLKPVALLNGLSKKVGNYAPIEVESALKDLESILVNTDRLEDDKKGYSFTIETLKLFLQAKSYNIIHFLTHGEFDNNTAALLTYDSVPDAKRTLTLIELGNIIQDYVNPKTPIDLITFSACSSALGGDDSSDITALGLAGTAVGTGARSAIATLWDVDQLGTILFMNHFYEQMRLESKNKAEALRNIQFKFADEEFGDKYPHPYYWSGFILVGNWL